MIPFAFFLTDAFTAMLCLLQNIGLAFVWAICSVVNLLIAAIGLTLAGVVALLPDIPEDWDGPPSSVTRPLNWFLPIHGFRVIFLGLCICYGVWLAIRVIANWMKVE